MTKKSKTPGGVGAPTGGTCKTGDVDGDGDEWDRKALPVGRQRAAALERRDPVRRSAPADDGLICCPHCGMRLARSRVDHGHWRQSARRSVILLFKCVLCCGEVELCIVGPP
jgi:hypothetical protein